MTNAEKYLKEGVSVEELADTIAKHYDTTDDIFCVSGMIQDFFNTSIQPTLTEDERVILRNIDKKFKYISRQYDDLRISYKPVGEEGELFYEYNHLFQFIKERRRIRDSRIIRR